MSSHTRKDGVSGVVPIMGTFVIRLPAIAATTYIQSTVATVPGITSNDALAVWLNRGTSAGYGEISASSAATSRVLYSAYPGDGNITVVFQNAGAATGYVEYIMTYLAAKPQGPNISA